MKLVRLLICVLLCASAAAWAQPRVVVVLAGGGAKGFAHLAVLRQLEEDRVPIARIVGTSMGAVIGGLYAAGLDTRQIEQVIGSLDPAKVALDQVNRLELPNRAREYQQQYPVDFEFGLQGGGLTFARGVSDGQRFLALLQQLLAHVPPSVSFDQLKIPFRAVATRYRDGAPHVFERGALDLAIRASMAAPGVFAPVDIEGEIYVDGGLVANLPVEVALKDGADVVVASYLGADEGAAEATPGHALAIANHMITLLIRQNERRNLALLRPQDILVSPALSDIGFAEFGRAPEVIARGQAAISAQGAAFERLAQRIATEGTGNVLALQRQTPAFNEREVRIADIRVRGQRTVPVAYVQQFFSRVLHQPHDPQLLAALVDALYTEGYFEQVSYKLEHIGGEMYALELQVTEKAYGPHFFKTSLGFFTELDGVQQFSLGLGYRRPWLTESGTELAVDARLGSQNDLGARLSQPLTQHLRGEAYAELAMQTIPLYVPYELRALNGRGKIANFDLQRARAGLGLAYDLSRDTTLRLGLLAGRMSYQVDSARSVNLFITPAAVLPLSLPNLKESFLGWRMQWSTDRLDSVSFPTTGYSMNVQWESGLRRGTYQGLQARARWANHWGPHVLNLGLQYGAEKTQADCMKCTAPSFLYLGGFQQLSAYRVAELLGDRLALASATYMYRLTDGGLLRQRAYAGLIGEAGDAWSAGEGFKAKYSLGVFLAVDSKIGDIYLGMAKGSQGSRNVFLQLGRRFSF